MQLTLHCRIDVIYVHVRNTQCSVCVCVLCCGVYSVLVGTRYSVSGHVWYCGAMQFVLHCSVTVLT